MAKRRAKKKAVKSGSKTVKGRKRQLYKGPKGGKFYRTKSGRTYV